MRTVNKGSFKMNDLSGMRFGKLLAISYAKNSHGRIYWLCKCDCGKDTMVYSTRLSIGVTKSCGCLKLRKGQNATHGLRNHPLYRIWRGMKDRCLNPKSKKYPDYGGRGITICPEWQNSMEKFYEDMIEGYQKGLEIDRIENDKGYYKANCRWATRLVNANNKRNCVYITYNGETMTAADWGRKLNIKDNTIANRKLKGYSDAECLFGKSTPIHG